MRDNRGVHRRRQSDLFVATVIETKAGETTYVQMVIVTGNWRGGGRLMQVDSTDAQKVIAKLKPLHE
jgi:hypothetical protein